MDEDFGDFNETTQDDDFGDFSTPLEPPPPPVEIELLKYDDLPCNELEESRLVTRKVDLPKHLDLFKKYWPLQREIPDHPVIPLFVKTGPNELIAVDERLRGDWYETFEKCQKNHIYNEESFRWRKSLIRTAFLESISVCVPFLKIGINEDLIIERVNRKAVAAEKKQASVTTTTKPTVQTTPQEFISTNESNNSTTDSREVELVDAKKLCDIPEDEIRRKSKAEIRDLISRLTTSLSKIQEQANYWLDAKEQLVMESEMHNKMIASLVSYAQQKEKAGNKKK